MKKSIKVVMATTSLMLFLILPTLSWSKGKVEYAGNIYTMTNDETANEVVRYGRTIDGKLVKLDVTATGGTGSGVYVLPRNSGLVEINTDPLFSVHGIVLTKSKDYLLAVNGGNNTVSVFKVLDKGELELVDNVDSGGTIPVSIAEYDHVVYVANAGDLTTLDVRPSLSGFRLTEKGKLIPIEGTKKYFGHPAESRITDILFNYDGSVLVAADAFSNEVITFPVYDQGKIGTRTVKQSAGVGPFGMAFSGSDILVVSEANAFGGIGVSSVSTYKLSGTELSDITPKLGNGETEACWLSVTPNGHYVYSSNSPSFFLQGPAVASVSVFALSDDGTLELINATAATRGSNESIQQNAGAVESLISKDGKFLYQLYSGYGEIVGYRINRDGSLTAIDGGAGTGLPLISPTGLAGY